MDLWNTEKPVTDFDIEVPAWIDQDITCADVAAIEQGGCASGAYMPAVTYHTALETMSRYGDEILDYLSDIYGSIPAPPEDSSWSSMACFFVSSAVETWALGAHSQLSEIDDEEAA